jgi:hypothetical protein
MRHQNYIYNDLGAFENLEMLIIKEIVANKKITISPTSKTNSQIFMS